MEGLGLHKTEHHTERKFPHPHTCQAYRLFFYSLKPRVVPNVFAELSRQYHRSMVKRLMHLFRTYGVIYSKGNLLSDVYYLKAKILTQILINCISTGKHHTSIFKFSGRHICRIFSTDKTMRIFTQNLYASIHVKLAVIFAIFSLIFIIFAFM